MRRLIIAVCAVIALAGCSSSSNASGGTSPDSTTATTTLTSTTPTPTANVTKQPKTKITYGTDAKTIAAQLHCVNLRPSPTQTDAINIPVQSTDEMLCELDGQTVDLTTFADAAKQAAALAFVEGIEKSFGAEVWIAAGDGWVASAADGSDDSAPLTAQKSVAQKVASLLDGKVMHWAPAASGS